MIMITLFRILAPVVLLLGMSATATAAITDFQVVQRIQIKETGSAFFRPVGLVTWGGDDCPGAVYAYITKDIPAYENILALVMASKLNQTPMRFAGDCSDDGRYLLVTYAFLD